MSKKSQELRKKAEASYRNMKDLYSKDNLTDEDSKKFDEWDKEYETLMKQAEKFEKLEKLEIEQEVADEQHDLTKPPKEKTAEEKREILNIALKEYYLTGRVSQEARQYFAPAKAEDDDKDFIRKEYERLGLISRAAQQSTTDGSGGYTIPQGFQAELERAMLAYGGMLEASRIWRTASGNVVDWPKINDTANRAYLLSEAGNAETSAVKLTDAQQQFEAYKITSGMLRLSSEIVQDSAFNMIQEVGSFLTERMQRGINYYATVGTGSSQPRGITIGAAHGPNTGNDTVLDAQDLINLEHEVDPSYRVNARFMFHDTVVKELKRLSVASSPAYPIWLPSFRDGQPATVLGYPYSINQDMAQFTYNSGSANDNAKIALFGNFQKYIIRLVGSMRMVRLVERFGDTDEIALCAFWRIDSDLLEAGTHPVKYLRVSAT